MPFAEIQLSDQPGADQQLQRTVHRSFRDAFSVLSEREKQVVGVEMAVRGEYCVQNGNALWSKLKILRSKILLERLQVAHTSLSPLAGSITAAFRTVKTAPYPQFIEMADELLDFGPVHQ